MSDDWVSEDTETKERHFHGILWTHATMCKGIIPRQSGRPYLYVDLHAGRGHLEYKGRQFIGSPLIARNVLSEIGTAYEAMHYEERADQAALLAEALWTPTSLVDVADARSHPIHVKPCEEGFAHWLSAEGHQHDRYGLIYSDPVRGELPHQLLNHAARQMPRVDLLAYVLATQYLERLNYTNAEQDRRANTPFEWGDDAA